MVRLEEHKHETEDKAIEQLPLSPKLYLSLSQHLGKICAPEVKPGDAVSLGQRIGSVQAHVWAPLHASAQGRVSSIQDWPHPVLGRCKAIAIDVDTQNQILNSKFQAPNPKPQKEIDSLTPEEIRKIVFDAGIVGMGGAGFPTHIKLSPPKPVDTLIINGSECEPYLTADFRLMVERTLEIIQGIKLLVQCLKVKDVFIAIEDNKPEAIKAFMPGIRGTGYGVRVLKSQYPQGGERQLIKNVLKKEVPAGKLPFDVGVVVHNVGTVFAVYEAVFLRKPLYERVVTVTGSCLENPKNILVRIGTPIKHLIDFCGPLKKDPAKIIIGGPMMGIAQYTDDVPVIKTTTGIVLLDEQEARTQEEEFCIRCGACVRACPAGLMPCLINLASEKEMWTEAKAYRAMECIECGLCNYVCPANRLLTQSIKRAKLEIGK